MPRPDPLKGALATTIHLGPTVRAEIARWAVDDHPDEACGVLVGTSSASGTRVERAFLAKNLETERAGTRFQLDPRDHLAAWRWAKERELDIVGFWHSHPDHPAEPSKADRQEAWERLSYLIMTVTASGAGELRSWRLRQGRFVEEAIRYNHGTP